METNNLILYVEFDRVLTIDADRNVFTRLLVRKMNTKQLRWILSNEKVTSRNIKGVYALDEIVHIKQKSFPSAYVFNLDPSYKPGVHWVAVYIDRRELLEYFDSFGRPPPREIKDF